ncbi:hypothetical protein MHYP_G00264210 [Metynnis hypsauchen]
MDPESITEIKICDSEREERELAGKGFTRVEGNLNRDAARPVTLWYKRGGDNPITRIQFSFRREMPDGLRKAGFTEDPKKISIGHTFLRDNIILHTHIHLWYMSGTTEFDFPIVDLRVTTSLQDEPALFSDNWERLGCDLNRNNGGHPVYVWVKRRERTYICDITATIGFAEDADLFNQGFFRVDEDTNRGVPTTPPGQPPVEPPRVLPCVFIWLVTLLVLQGVSVDVGMWTEASPPLVQSCSLGVAQIPSAVDMSTTTTVTDAKEKVAGPANTKWTEKELHSMRPCDVAPCVSTA